MPNKIHKIKTEFSIIKKLIDIFHNELEAYFGKNVKNNNTCFYHDLGFFFEIAVSAAVALRIMMIENIKLP